MDRPVVDQVDDVLRNIRSYYLVTLAGKLNRQRQPDLA